MTCFIQQTIKGGYPMTDHFVINSSNTPILWILIPFALIMLALLIGIGITHYFLSKSKNKKLGWFVPTVFFVLGLVLTIFCALVLFTRPLRMFFILLGPFQIPTIIFLAIYIIVRFTMKREDPEIEIEIYEIEETEEALATEETLTPVEA